MKIACAWCGADLGEKPPLEDTRTSHGICASCKTSVATRLAIHRLQADLEALGEMVACRIDTVENLGASYSQALMELVRGLTTRVRELETNYERLERLGLRPQLTGEPVP